MDIESTLQGFVNQPAVQSLGARFGLSPEQLKDATAKVLPVVLSQLKSLRGSGGDEQAAAQVSQIAVDPDEEGAEEKAYNQPNDSVNSLLGNKGDALGGLLSSVLGSGGQGAAGGGKELIGALLPLLLGFLQKQGVGNSGGGGLLGGLASMLDQDKDGSALDDVSAMVLGEKQGAAGQPDGKAAEEAQESGGVGGLLGKIFGKK